MYFNSDFSTEAVKRKVAENTEILTGKKYKMTFSKLKASTLKEIVLVH